MRVRGRLIWVSESSKYSTAWIHTYIWACACVWRFEVGCQNPAYDYAIHSFYHMISYVYSGASNTATAAECNCICVCVAVRYGCQNPTYIHSIAWFHACTLMKHIRRQRCSVTAYGCAWQLNMGVRLEQVFYRILSHMYLKICVCVAFWSRVSAFTST